MKRKFSRKKKIIILATSVLLIAVFVIGFFISCNASIGEQRPEPQGEGESITLIPPDDGSMPEEYDAIKNIGFIIGRLASSEYYHTDSRSDVSAGTFGIMVEQKVNGGKDYKDGILIATTFSQSQSAFAPQPVAMQKFFGDGKAVIRQSVSNDPSTWNGAKTEWSDGEPTEILDRDTYIKTYGLWGTEFSDYVIDEETCLSFSDLKQEGGLYTLSVELDPIGATGFYAVQMRTMGGLSALPVFKSVHMVFEFDADWRIHKLTVDEAYSSKMGVISADCTGKTVIEYSYDESDVDVSAFEEYFKNYASAATTGTAEKELTAADYFSRGMGYILTDVSQFRADLTVGGQQLSALLRLDMREGEFRSVQASAGSLNILFEGGSDLYLSYGDSFNAKLDISLLGTLFGGDAQSDSLLSSLDMNALSSAVGGGTVVKGENGEAAISCEIPLGEAVLPLEFGFYEESGEVTFRYIRLRADIADLSVEAEIVPCDRADLAEIDKDNAVDLAPMVETLAELIETKKFSVDLDYSAGGLHVKGNIALDVSSETAAFARLTVESGQMTIPVELTWYGNVLYAEAYGMRVCGTAEELESLFGQISELIGADISLPELSAVPDIDAGALLSGLDLSSLLREISLTEEQLSVTLGGTELSSLLKNIFGADVALGDVLVKYIASEWSFEVSAAGLCAALSVGKGGIGAPEDADAFVSVAELARYIEPVKGMIGSMDIAFSVNGSVSIFDIAFRVEAYGEVWFDDGLRIFLDTYIDDDTRVRVYYNEGELLFAFGEYGMRVSEADFGKVADSFASLFASNRDALGDSTAAGMLLFSSEGFDLQALIEKIRLSTGQNGALVVCAELSQWLGEAGKDLSLSLTTDGERRIDAEISDLEIDAQTALRGLSLRVECAENELTPDFSDVRLCKHVFETVLNAYEELFGSEYIGIGVEYRAADLAADVNGVLQFERSQEEGNTSVVLNLNIGADLIIYDEAGAPTGSHFIRVIIDRDMVYITYSVKAADSPDALKLKMPVSALFDAGETVLPLLAPLLGISEDVYYFDFVNAILGGYYETINSDIFAVMDTEQWCDLIAGIVAEYASDGGAEQPSQAAGTSVSFDGASKALNIAAEGVCVRLYVAENADIAAPQSAEGYLDFSAAAQLLQDLLLAYDYTDTGYRLIGSVGLSVIGIELDLKVGLDLRIQITEGEGITLHATLQVNEYQNYLVWGFFGTKCIVDGNTVTELTIRDGTVYLTRHRTSQWNGKEWAGIGGKFVGIDATEYRRMSLAEFGDDAVEQIFFALNISSGAKNYILGKIGESGDSSSETGDVGQMLNAFTASQEGYAVTLDLGAIVGDSALGKVQMDISRTPSENQSGKYDLTQLSGSVVLVEVIKANFTLNHVTPGQQVDFSVIDANIERVNANLAMAA